MIENIAVIGITNRKDLIKVTRIVEGDNFDNPPHLINYEKAPIFYTRSEDKSFFNWSEQMFHLCNTYTLAEFYRKFVNNDVDGDSGVLAEHLRDGVR